MKLNEAVAKYTRLLNENDNTLILDGESGSTFDVNTHNYNNFYLKDCNYKTLLANNTNFYITLRKCVIDNIDLKNVKGKLECSVFSGSVKINKGKVTNFTDLHFECNKTTLKDVEFINGNSLELSGSAIKLRNIKIKNVKKVDIRLEGNVGKINLEIENCGEVNFYTKRDIICNLDKVIVTNCNIGKLDFQNRRDKVVVNKFIFNKCTIPDYIRQLMSRIGNLPKIINAGFNTVNDALKDDYYDIILIDC